MHKITKGLKKKKKGKKSKHKEEELFKPEELEAYRREHQHTSESGEIAESAAPTENEEWKKFNALTAGIDTFLKKTQGDLDRIKSTSYFQRVPPPSELKKKEEEERNSLEKLSIKKEEPKPLSVTEAAIVPVSESESEYEDEDDIFDTTYIDVIASGEVKLAYIPESPKEEPEGDDPFDTSIAERAILGPSVDKKGKKLVPIGSAVEILTGRVQAPTCVPIRRPSTRRQIQKEKDLLLESFDDNANNIEGIVKAVSPNKTTLLDDDAPVELLNTPIDLSQSLHLAAAATVSVTTEDKEANNKFRVLEGFNIVGYNPSEEDEDDEFALLAAESLNKKIVTSTAPVSTHTAVVLEDGKDTWDAFYEERTGVQDIDEFAAAEDDPFDTTFAENILPGKAELKIIEDEILNVEDDFNPRGDDAATNDVTQKVSIQITDPSGQRESVITADRVSEQELKLIQPSHRDLLGGSSTDLSKLGDQPLQPRETASEDYIEYCDPFDTSIVESVKLPGQTELKFLERELLGVLRRSLSDENFDPRADEILEKQQTRKVSFDLPLEQHQNLLEASSKISKPLTPYYLRENSIPEIEELTDPFDTSFVSDVAPGKAELKLIENELFEKNVDTFLDPDFDPRDNKKIAVVEIVQRIEHIITSGNSKPNDLILPQKTLDLLSAENDVQAKVLTPATEKSIVDDYTDPFDTSIACNILPGKTELKLLENELINAKQNVKEVYDFTTNVQKSELTNKNLIEEETSNVDVKPLTPILDRKTEFELEATDDIDPFDTSIANNIGLGKTELKILESELI